MLLRGGTIYSCRATGCPEACWLWSCSGAFDVGRKVSGAILAAPYTVASRDKDQASDAGGISAGPAGHSLYYVSITLVYVANPAPPLPNLESKRQPKQRSRRKRAAWS